MNTKTKQGQKQNHRRETQREQGLRGKQGHMLNGSLKRQEHEQEHPETRLTR
jgi:hypothetical protein